MEKIIESYVDELQQMNSNVILDMSDFHEYGNELNFEEYLDTVVTKYVPNKEDLYNHVYEKNLNNTRRESCIFTKDGSFYALIPERKTIFDEIASIHEITHLIHRLKVDNIYQTSSSEIIPFFNEYDYLKKYYSELLGLYQDYRLETAKSSARYFHTNKKAIQYIKAYLMLELRKNDYDIDFLNNINASEKKLEKKLIKNGYSVK